MPPSSSGGVVLIEMLNILEGIQAGRDRTQRRALHLMVEAMKRAYFDRARFLGDPASVTPPPYLTSKRFAETLRERIDPARAAAAASFGSIFAPAREGDNTTHFSVVDRFGNAVANTTTLNLSYGVGLVAEGTGVLLNNELDDFAAKPGAPNAFGLVGGEANAPGTAQAPVVVDDADHRAQGRQAVYRHRLAGRQPHHHDGAAGARQRHRSQAADRGGDLGAARASPVVARRSRGRAADFPPT